jgi:hypothetical protein
MYFADLSQYSYGDSEPDPSILNVGWLSRAYPYTQGTVSELFVARLLGLVQSPVNLYRGLHFCEFCPGPEMRTTPRGLRIAEPLPGTAGNGEIRVRGTSGRIYVAPVLIHHYVTAHCYLPPAEFISAVEAES